MASQNKINYHLNLPWTYTVETTCETGELLFIVHVNELPGIATHAATLNDAMQDIREAMTALFELYLEDGKEIPQPTD